MVRDVCEAITEKADWQWNVNAWGKQDNPATALSYYLLYPRLVDLPATRETAFGWLLYGQRHHPDAQRLYRDCRKRGEDHLYWWIISAAGNRMPDLDAVATHLEWQAHNDPLSMAEALAAWRAGPQPGPPADQHRVAAAYRLLAGQRHNANASQLYRACLGAAAERVFALVSSLTSAAALEGLRHPYLDGEEPSPTSVRDEVPAGGRHPRPELG
jgi:hypothetical protein